VVLEECVGFSIKSVTIRQDWCQLIILLCFSRLLTSYTRLCRMFRAKSAKLARDLLKRLSPATPICLRCKDSFLNAKKISRLPRACRHQMSIHRPELRTAQPGSLSIIFRPIDELLRKLWFVTIYSVFRSLIDRRCSTTSFNHRLARHR